MAHKQTISFTEPQAAYLKAEAAKMGVSFADLVRRIVDDWRGKQQQAKRA